MEQSTPTYQNYEAFHQAFDYFNKTLFDGTVPPPLITLQRGRRFMGYFCPERFKATKDGKVTHELAMNPNFFLSPPRVIMAVLVHEMCHEWQEVFGKPSKGKWHNKEWGSIMKDVGLYPSNTGRPGGKETGERMSHYIIEGGPFDRAYREFEARGFTIPWAPNVTLPAASPKGERDQEGGTVEVDDEAFEEGAPEEQIVEIKPPPTRTKFRCPCGDQAWGKPSLLLVCGKCQGSFMPIEG